MSSKLGTQQGSKRMQGLKRKGIPRPIPVSQPVLADPGWTNGSHCKAQLTVEVVEVVEVVQGVEDELPLRGISAQVVLIPQ